MRLRTSTFVAALLALPLTLVGAARPLFAQSLADVAKQEEDRRKTVKDTGKVYTNKDLKYVPPVSPPSGDAAPADAAASSTPAADGQAATAAGKDQPAAAPSGAVIKDQKYWKGRMTDLEAQLERDQTLADAMQGRVSSLTMDSVNRDDPAQRTVIDRDRQKAVDELTHLKQSVEGDKKAITALEDEARRASVPAGWLR